MKNDIDSRINSSLEKIKNNLKIIEINREIIKKNWTEILDYSGIDCDSIRDGFDTFIQQKINYEEISFNTFLKDNIRNNFNILMNNFVDAFGNDFFERIIKYNENFKIPSLYNNLKYSLGITLTYYQKLYSIKKTISSLTKDLKIKLYNLNNFDLIVSEKYKKALDLLNNNVDEFIENSMNYFINNYKLLLKEDISIKSQLNEEFNINLVLTLEEISNLLQQDYISLFNEKFKKKNN